ncbi:hypothetical protein [Halalkalicoccus jeotgali]|nr:hypothetical protein [Halalkalicoccus jeotgali]
MGYSVELRDGEEAVGAPRHTEGGSYALSGVTKAKMSVTFNYSEFFEEALDEEEGLRWLNDKRAGDTEARLREAVDVLGTEQSDDYWEATAGNAGHALSILLAWAQQHPDAEWWVV